MASFIAAIAEMVAAAVVQEAVSGAISVVLGKRKEKASQGEYLERLSKAVHEVEFVLERTAKLPITEVSLLRDRIELKRDFIEAATCLLSSRPKKQQGQPKTSQVVARCSSPHGLFATHRAMLPASSFTATSKDELCLSCDDVERFERLADSARSILTRVESGCSLRHLMHFSSPLVRHLFEWKTLLYRTVQSDHQREFFLWPTRLEEERGVEAVVGYRYSDHKRPDKSFCLLFVLRLSEGTNIIGIAIKCLQALASEFNIMADTATRELSLLASLQDVSHSHALPWIGIQEEHSDTTQMCRQDPLCCKAKGKRPSANKDIVSSEISQVFPEEAIFFRFECFISAPEYRRCSSADARGTRSIMRNRKPPPLQLAVCVAPRYMDDDKRQQESYTFEKIGDDGQELIDISTQQMGEMVRPRAMDCFLRQPKVMEYTIGWVTKHGAASFIVEKQSAGALKTSSRAKS